MKKTIIIFLYCLILSRCAYAASDYGQLQEVCIKPGYDEQNGIEVIYKDFVIKTETGGKKCIATDIKKGNNFINFDVDDSFIFDGNFSEAILTVEYFDIGFDTFSIQYDSSCPWPFEGAFTRAGKIIKKENTKTWKTYTTRLRNIRFANRQGYGLAQNAVLKKRGGDFRINNRGDGNEYIAYAAIKMPYITIATNEFGNIFDNGKDVSISVNVNNRESKDFYSTLGYKVTDLNETIICKENKIHVPNCAKVPYELKTEVDKNGIFYLYLSLYDDTKKLDEYMTSFAVCPMPTYKTESESPFGVTTFLQYGEVKQTVKILRRLNIGWIRQNLGEGYIEAEKNKFEWEGSDALVTECYENSINICCLLLGSTAYDPCAGSDEAIESFSNLASNIVYRYKDKIKCWEIWNEPDLTAFWPSGPNAANYTKLLSACYTAIKAMDPASCVLIGGLGGGTKNKFWFLDHIYKNKGGDSFDGIAIHPYTMPYQPEKDNTLESKINDAVTRLQRNNADKKIFITEIGWPTGGTDGKNVSLKDQANFLVRAYIIALSNANVEKVFWHSFRNLGTDRSSSEQNFGLVNNDFTPKPAAAAYLNMVNQLDGLKYVGRLNLKDSLRGYIFGEGDKKITVFWSLNGEEVLYLPVRNNKQVFLTDMVGNVCQMQPKRGKLKLFLTESPLFFEE